MKKKINPFAYVLALLAVTYALLAIPAIIEILRQPTTMAYQHDAAYVQSFATRDILIVLRGVVYESGMLIGMAVVIELADRILWNATHKL